MFVLWLTSWESPHYSLLVSDTPWAHSMEMVHCKETYNVMLHCETKCSGIWHLNWKMRISDMQDTFVISEFQCTAAYLISYWPRSSRSLLSIKCSVKLLVLLTFHSQMCQNAIHNAIPGLHFQVVWWVLEYTLFYNEFSLSGQLLSWWSTGLKSICWASLLKFIRLSTVSFVKK